MSNRLRACFLATVLVASAWARPAGQGIGPVAQGQAGASQAPVPATGFIAGQVVDATTGRPIGDATVMLLRLSVIIGPGRGSAAPPTPVVTDPSGRFFFSGLTPGSYSVRADRAGYTSPRTLAVAVELGENERQLNARVRLVRTASISGTLRDTAGDPIVGTELLVFRRTVINGRPGLQSLQRGVKSDDRGTYRIPLLAPGAYLICACLRDPNPLDPLLLTTLASQPLSLMSVAARALTVGADVVALDNSLRMYAPTFHPDSPTASRATPVTVAPGEDKVGVDITAELVRLARVSGRVVGAQSPVVASSIRLIPAADAESGIDLTQIQPMLVQADGRFDFASVPPGQYRLVVMHRETGATGGGPTGLAIGLTGGRASSPPPAPVAMAGPGATPPPILWANELLSVGDVGVSGHVVSLARAFTVAGRLQFVGSSPQPTEQVLTRLSIVLQPVVTSASSTAAIGPVRPNATFQAIGAVPGKYTVSFANAPWGLKSVTLGGVDVSDLPIEIGEKDPPELVLVLGDTPLASLTFSAPAVGAQPRDGEAVLLFPSDKKYWAEPLAARRRFRTLALSSKLSATASDIPGGEYLVVLVADLEAFDWQESSRLDELSRRAQRVTVNDGEKKTIEVRR